MATISLQFPQIGQPNATEDPKITSDFTVLQTLLNGNIDTGNLSPTAGITLAQLSGLVQQAMFAPGDLKASAATAAPAGWLVCDGSAVSRATFSALFAVCGTTWGAGDGTTTFNLPDLRGRAAIGAGTGSGLSPRALGAVGGQEAVTLTAAQSGIPSATINVQASGGSITGGGVSIPTSSAAASSSSPLATTVATNASTSHENMPPYGVLNWMVKT